MMGTHAITCPCAACVDMAPVVVAFANAMMRKLHANHHKGDRDGWCADSPWHFIDRVDEEAKELRAEVASGCLNWKLDAILNEAADVANIAMMVADAAGAIECRTEPPQPPIPEASRGCAASDSTESPRGNAPSTAPLTGSSAPSTTPAVSADASGASDECAFCSTLSGIVEEYRRAIERLRPGHTDHCNSGFVHGHGECECGAANGASDERIARTIIESEQRVCDAWKARAEAAERERDLAIENARSADAASNRWMAKLDAVERERDNADACLPLAQREIDRLKGRIRREVKRKKRARAERDAMRSALEQIKRAGAFVHGARGIVETACAALAWELARKDTARTALAHDDAARKGGA